MQQGQTDILIARFPDPNYGVKTVNFIITPLTYRELFVSFSLRHLEVSLSLVLVGPTQASILCLKLSCLSAYIMGERPNL